MANENASDTATEAGAGEGVSAPEAAIRINDLDASAIRYMARVIGNELQHLDVKFMDGRKLVVEVGNLDRKAAIALLGESNVLAIEAGRGKDKAASERATEAEKEATPGVTAAVYKGRLQGKHLEYVEAFTADYPVNTVEMGIEEEQTMDAEVVATARLNAERRRRDDQRLQQVNTRAAQDEEKALATDSDGDRDKAAQGQEQDPDSVVPPSVSRRFVQVEEKFYFPDEQIAFIDHGTRLRARAEHKEVVSAIVSIAVARGWDKITVKGTEVFRRAVWMEAAERGLEVKGYKPSEVELAKLAAKTERRGHTMAGEDGNENVVEKGITREAEKSLDQTPHNGDKASAKLDGAPLKSFSGTLLEHGKARYNHDPKEQMSYFVRMQTDDGVKVIWGVDLPRALEEGKVSTGDRLTLNYMGNLPVTVTVDKKDDKGRVIGQDSIQTHRNTWRAEKAEAFRTQERDAVLQKHPDLAGVYGAQAAAKKFSERLPAAEQERFVKETEKELARRIEKGEKLPKPKALTKRAKDLEAEQQRQAREKKAREPEMTR